MGTTLTPDNLPAGRDRRTGRGHGTAALGPSDSSDSGSDLAGAHGLAHDADRFGLERGTNEDPEEAGEAASGGPDVGDGNLDSDSDRFGTGEDAAAGRDTPDAQGSDIDVDHVEGGSADLDVSDRPDLADNPVNLPQAKRRRG